MVKSRTDLGIKHLFNRMNEALQMITDFKIEREKAKANKSFGRCDALSKRILIKERAAKFYLEELMNAGQGNMITVFFKILPGIQEPLMFHTFTNISKEEGELLTRFWAESKGYKITFLEVKETCTSKIL